MTDMPFSDFDLLFHPNISLSPLLVNCMEVHVHECVRQFEPKVCARPDFCV